MSLYSGSAGTPAFKNRTVVSDYSKLTEKWKLEQADREQSNKGFEWVSGLDLENQKIANEWADRMGQRDVKALQNLLNTISQKVLPIAAERHLEGYKKDIREGGVKFSEVGPVDYKKLTEQGVITASESQLKGEVGLTSAQIEKVYGQEFAEWWRTANRAERAGFKIATMKSKAENFDVWMVNRVAELQEAAKKDPENQRSWANPRDPKVPWTIGNKRDDSEADRAITMSLWEEYINEVALSVPGTPLRPELVSYHLSGPALGKANKGLKDRGIARNKLKGANALAQSQKELINAFDDYDPNDEASVKTIRNELKYIVSNIAPELRMEAGTQAPTNGTWNSVASDKRKEWIDQDIKTAKDPLKRAKDWAEVLNHKDQWFIHPAGKARLATDNLGEPIKIGEKDGKPIYRREKVSDAVSAFGDWASVTALTKAGRDYTTARNKKLRDDDRINARHALANVAGEAEEAKKDGVAVNQDWYTTKEKELMEKHKYSWDLIQNHFSKFYDKEVISPGTQQTTLLNLKETRFLEITRKDLKDKGIDEGVWELFNAGNPDVQLVEKYFGSDNETEIKGFEQQLIKNISAVREQTSVNGDTSKWTNDTKAFHYLYRKELYERAIKRKRLEKPGTYSDWKILDLENVELQKEMDLINDPSNTDPNRTKSWMYMKPGVGFENARELRTGAPKYTEAQILISKAKKINDGWEIRKKTRFFKDLKYLEKLDRDGDGQADYHPTMKRVAAMAGVPVDKFWEKENRLSEQPQDPPEREEPVEKVVTACYDLIDTRPGLGIGGIHTWTDLNSLGNIPSRKVCNVVTNEIRSNLNQVDPHQVGTLIIKAFPKPKDDKRTDAKYRSDIESLVTKAISLSPADKNGQLWNFAVLFYGLKPEDMHTNPYVSSLARELVDEIRTPQSEI